MDIKEAAQKVISEVKNNPQLLKKLGTNAEATVKEVLKDGKLTAEEIRKIAEEAVKQLGLSGTDSLDKIKDLFLKK